MAATYRQVLEEFATTLATTTLARAGNRNPSATQQRAAERCALLHTLQEIRHTNPDLFKAIGAELSTEHATVAA